MTTAGREFLKPPATGVAGASLLTMLQARQAPAQIKGTSLRILQWSHFVPAYDTWFDEFVKKWCEQAGVKVRVDRIPHLELPPRFAAEFAAGAGHDLIYFVGTILTALYHKNLEALNFRGAFFEEGRSPAVSRWHASSASGFCASGAASGFQGGLSAYRAAEDTSPKVFRKAAVALGPQGLPGKGVSIANPNAYAI